MNAETPLVELINQRLAGDLRSLPVFHSVVIRLRQLLTKRNFRIEEMIALISKDQALASHVLKTANSSFYSGLPKVTTIKNAVVRLGAQEIASLAMLASQSESYPSENEILNRFMHTLSAHALSCATGAKWLATKTGHASLASEAFMGGLLHDIGKLAIIKVLDEILQTSGTQASLSEILINEILDTMHEGVGHRLLRSWRLPEAYCSIAVNHRTPDFDGNDILLVLVRLSNLACRKVDKAIHSDPSLSLLSVPEVHYLGVKEITLAELQIVVEDAGVGNA